MRSILPLPSLQEVESVLLYHPETGIWVRLKTGQPAGRLTNYGYRKVGVGPKEYLAHRLAWLWVHKEDPGRMLIDHIDGNKDNNRICNLRLATSTQNAFNSVGYGRSGLKGIYKRKNRYEVTVNKEYIGLYASIEEAVRVYNETAVKLYGKFALLNTFES